MIGDLVLIAYFWIGLYFALQVDRRRCEDDADYMIDLLFLLTSWPVYLLARWLEER